MPAQNYLTPQLISRSRLNPAAWDACVSMATQSVLYGYSWYLDAVLPAPAWKWAGIVLMDKNGQYRAVMPVPLRRKTVAGIPYLWMVHQPFFCQFLGVFSREESLDLTPFFQLMVDEFRYGSRICTQQEPDKRLLLNTVDLTSTHLLDLAVGYQALYRNYTRDRKENLRRAVMANWSVMHATDPEPLLTLFKNHHVHTIQGGVAPWAYDILRKLVLELEKRNLVTLRYALRNGQIEAGVLFVQAENRVVYLFNAASETGRSGNARTLLIDQFIQEKAGQPLVFDFESPQKTSVREFYRSFGAVDKPFWTLRWTRLKAVERMGINLKKWLAG